MSIHPSVSPWINRRHDGGAAQLEMRFSSLLVWTLVMLVCAGVTTSYSMVVTQYSYRQILSIMSNGLFSFQNSFSMRNAENLGQWNPVSFKKLNTKRLCRCAILYNVYWRKSLSQYLYNKVSAAITRECSKATCIIRLRSDTVGGHSSLSHGDIWCAGK